MAARFRVLAWGAVVAAVGNAQTARQSPKVDVQFRWQAERVEQGLPQAFIFLLVNQGESEVRLPVPAIGCSGGDTYRGDISIQFKFTPRVTSQGGLDTAVEVASSMSR
ncbi:MAG TPA: hypothetical protein VHW09_28700 [Bryobacteraceae bacterium]|jgi:N-acetylglutamate synthase/N-acetylornithine aminotransferase|nr:hypothetical protein [Bryobacteraceae bacterium]